MKASPPHANHASSRGPTINVTTDDDARPVSISSSNGEAMKAGEEAALCRARKRKERHESTCSLVCQERKVIRSNSEERPKASNDSNPTGAHSADSHSTILRRVASHENFQEGNFTYYGTLLANPTATTTTSSMRCSSHNNATDADGADAEDPPELAPINSVNPCYDDEATEMRRRHERSLQPKPILHNSKKSDRCRRAKQQQQQQQLATVAAPTAVPSVTFDLDLSALHRQVDSSAEPLRSNNDVSDTLVASSPPLSVDATPTRFAAVNNGSATRKATTSPSAAALRMLTKQIDSVRRQIKLYEIEVHSTNAADNGGRTTVTSTIIDNKLGDKCLRSMYLELARLQREQSDMSADADMMFEGLTRKPGQTLLDTVKDIEKHLDAKRQVARRSPNVDELTDMELFDEKVLMQKALLYLEAVHGRPIVREERDLVRHLYERYRTLKRMLARVTLGVATVVDQLSTIHEDEPVTSFGSTPPATITARTTPETIRVEEANNDYDDVVNENDVAVVGHNHTTFHMLSRQELQQELTRVRSLKGTLKRHIKLFEADVEEKLGRRVQKEDRVRGMEDTYLAYKKAKAKIKLLDALLGKTGVRSDFMHSY